MKMRLKKMDNGSAHKQQGTRRYQGKGGSSARCSGQKGTLTNDPTRFTQRNRRNTSLDTTVVVDKMSHRMSWKCAASVSEDALQGIKDVSPSKVVDVSLGDRSYPIYIGENLIDNGELLNKHIQGKQVLIVTNETLAPLYLDRLTASIREASNSDIQVESVVLPDGEQHKNMEVLMKIFDKAMSLQYNRKSTFIALGGGVIGDMTGFAAATFQRGVNFIQVPTTLMAMVDSAVGGKTAVNHPLGKNMIGAFYQPNCVLTDTLTLKTLPRRETASGVSEVIKYGLIWDADLFVWLEKNMEALVGGDPEAVAYAVESSCIIKAAIVEQDEHEEGIRATLNLGHTFGHAIENFAGYGSWLHGEAVGTGILMAANLSERLGWIDKDTQKRAKDLIKRAELPLDPPETMSPDDFIDLMQVDKKNVDGSLRLVLLQGELGKCLVTADFDHSTLQDTLNGFCKSLK